MKRENLLRELGYRIREHRVRQNITLEQLSGLTGMNYKYLGEVERGHANISVVNLYILADSLKIPLNKLLRFTTREKDWDKDKLIAMMGTFNEEKLWKLWKIMDIMDEKVLKDYTE